MTVCSTATIPPKLPKTTDAKFLIYRILIIKPDGSRKIRNVRIYTDDLNGYRESFKAIHHTERIYFSYHEKEN